MKTIHVATDFSEFPAGRVTSDGPFSGEALAQLVHIALAGDDVELDLDGTKGYGGSFICGFGDGLRARGWTPEKLTGRLGILTKHAALAEDFLAELGFPALREV